MRAAWKERYLAFIRNQGPLKINHQQNCSHTYFRFKLKGGLSSGRERCSRWSKRNRAANLSEIIFPYFCMNFDVTNWYHLVWIACTWAEDLAFYWWRWSGGRISHCLDWRGRSFSCIKIVSITHFLATDKLVRSAKYTKGRCEHNFLMVSWTIF